MEYTIDNVDNVEKEELERAQRRKERIMRMRKEKQRQLKRRRAIKIMTKSMVGILALALIIILAGWMLGFKSKETGVADAEKENAVSTETEVLLSEEYVPEEVVPEEVMLAQKEEEPYKFVTTSETKSIYSDEVISSYAILIDENADTIVASKGAKERISPASMTKVLTILVAAENITEEQLDDVFVMTREITDYGYVNDCSSVGFLDGEEVKVRDLFYGTILPSGSDAAMGLATYVAGSHEAFVDMMNDKLVELGLGETSHYTNCVGLYDAEHYSTVYDMAVIMKAAVQSEFCKAVLSEHRYVTQPTTEHPEGIDISNWFLRRIEDKDTGGEVLCAKTGYVMQSKNCAVSYGIFESGEPYICVTAGSSSSWRCIYDHVEIYNEYI